MQNGIADKSYKFAIKIVWTYKKLTEEKREFVLSKQIRKSGTSVGALVKEAQHAQSKADFLNKMNIALKEANETDCWLMLLTDTKYLASKEAETLQEDCDEILKLLASIVKTTKDNLGRR